jgi:hypothetical protein
MILHLLMFGVDPVKFHSNCSELNVHSALKRKLRDFVVNYHGRVDYVHSAAIRTL